MLLEVMNLFAGEKHILKNIQMVSLCIANQVFSIIYIPVYQMIIYRYI
jgi:hypothetical protein